MERSSSFGSQSSAGSAFTSKSATTKLVNEAEKENALDGQAPGLLTALFGALYTLAKEKINDTAQIAMLAIWVDFLMIFTLILMPEYPWEVDPDLWIYKIFYYIQIHLPIAYTGYTFYLAIFYIMVSILFISVAICVWVGWCFMNDSFPFLWPIKVARVVVSLFVSMFYLLSLNVFLVACACNKEDDGHWKHLYFKVDCLSMPHLVHAVMSLLSAVVFFTVAILLVLGDHELEPMTKSLLAAPHSMCELRALLCKTVISFADILFKPLPHFQTVLYCLACGLIFYYHARMVPHYVTWINVLRGGLNAVLAWVSLICCILTYTVHWEWDEKHHPHWDKHDYRHAMTTLMAAGVPVAFLAGAGLCWGHLVYAWKTALKFKVLPEGVKFRNIHRFWTEFDVEIASRIGRVWDSEGVLDQTALDVAENVLKAGVAMKPKSVFMHIAYSNFLIDVRKNVQSGWNQLDAATALGPNLSYQFSVFSRKQEHKQQSGGAGGGEGAVDLVSYVEFQKNYKSLLVYHKASLVATRDFWRLLARDRVPLDRLGHSFSRMDEMESKAEATYKIVLDRYPSNAKLLRSYAKFLESIKNDPWGAARYYAEAEKQEELEESKAADIQVGGDVVNDKSSAIVTINAVGTIQMANKVATQMLGYKRGELNGKNVSTLMPPPFSTRHNSYLRNFANTGKAKILDRYREVVALHKERYVFPVTLKVTRISGTGVDAIFMGVMKPTVSDPGSIKAWLLPTGTILCVDLSFMDYAGWGPSELIGRAFSSLGTDNSVLDDLIAQAGSYTEEQLEDGALTITTNIKHKHGQPVPVHMKVTMGGTESQRILVMCMKQLAETEPMGAFDQKGQCIYANSPMASLLGYKLSMLRSKDITQLLPQPHGMLHLSYFRDADHMAAKPPAGSCRSNMTNIMLTSNNNPVYVIPTIIPHTPTPTVGGLAMLTDRAASSGVTFAFKVQRSSKTQYLNERRLMLGVTATGTIMWTSAGTPEALFGVSPQGIVGQGIASMVDVFEEYTSGDPDAQMSTALAALVNCTAAKPGTSWRVGVGHVTAADQAKVQDKVAAAAAAAAAEKRIMLRQASSKVKTKPAVMTVTMPGDDSLIEETAGASPDVALFIELWRADLVLGVTEVAEHCSIARAEPGMGLLFGMDQARMVQHDLKQYLMLSPDTQLSDLMGSRGTKKGGMKGSYKSKAGPIKELQGVHPDGRPLTVSLQAVLKDGSSEARLVLAIKPLRPLAGAPRMLEELIAAEAAEAAGVTKATTQAVPGLALDRLKAASGTDSNLLDTHRGTHRSNVPGSNLVTARLVDIDMPPGDDEPHRAPAHLADSPTGSDEAKHHKHAGFGASPTGSEQGRDMDVSSGGGSEEAHPAAKHKKKHLTEDQQEALHAAKGAKKAREWLEAGFTGFKKTPDPFDSSALPGAVDDPDGPAALFKRGGEGSNSSAGGGAAGQDDAGGAAGDKGAASDAASGSVATTNTANDTGIVSDYGRGKRLRKLMRLLSSKAALQVVVSFRFRVILLVAAICIVHLGAFGALLAFISKQDSMLDDVEAAGDVVDLVHQIAGLAVVLDAAGRGYGFAAADLPKYAAEMEYNYNRLDTLHANLYLGFGRNMEDVDLYHLWHDENLNATAFLDASNPAATTLQRTSLFALGATLVAAAKEVQFAALNPGSAHEPGPLANMRAYRFLQANGPGTMYSPYLKTVDGVVAQATGNARKVQMELLVLLCLEGAGFMILAVILIIRLLRSISVHRQALFSVFLAVPHTYLRTLASKSVSIGDEDAEEEDDDDKIMQAAEDARKKKQAEQAKRAEKEHDQEQDWGSMPGTLVRELAIRQQQKKKGKKAMFAEAEGDGDVKVSVKQGAGGKGPNASGKGSFSMGPAGAVGDDPAADKQRLFNGKELVTSTKSAYQLSWPIVVWGMLVLLLYGISYNNLSSETDTMVYIKMTQKSRIAASRASYFALRANLEQDLPNQLLMQNMLGEESKHLAWVYNSALYGSGSQKAGDAAAQGDLDHTDGCLFAAKGHKHILFDTDECLRDDGLCVPTGNPYYPITRNGLDALVMRLVEESMVMSRSNTSVLGPTHPGFEFLWNAAWYDLHDGFSHIIHDYVLENKQLFNTERIIHILLIIIMVIGGAAFLLMMIRPFLRHTSKESRRCAELLVQLPPDFDVEGMVAATWSVVKKERLLVERSGKTFFETAGLMGTLKTLSRSFLGPRPPLHGLRLSAMGPDSGEDKLFTSRYETENAGRTPRRGQGDPYERETPFSRSSPIKGSPNRRSGRTPVPEEFFEDQEEQVDEEHGGMAEGGRGGLRHRHPALPAAGRGGGAKGSPRAAHSRRAIVPVDDELL